MYITDHALDRINDRSIVTPDEVLNACQEHLARIRIEAQAGTPEVRIIVKRFENRQRCADGSYGELVVAAIDPASERIKTVMLSKISQVQRRRIEVPYFGAGF